MISGPVIRKWRTRCGLSLLDLANAVWPPCSPSYLSLIERELRALNPVLGEDLSKAMQRLERQYLEHTAERAAVTIVAQLRTVADSPVLRRMAQVAATGAGE